VSQFECVLSPYRHDEKARTMALECPQWDKSLKYAKLAGFAAPETGMARDAARCFAQALRTAVQAGRVAQGDLEWVGRLLTFLDGDGRSGFGVNRQWRSWRRASVTK
jgi:hypothetical protein